MSKYSLLTRGYDLRGTYPTEIDADFFYRLGYAFARVSGKKRIALGYDARLSSVELKDAFIQGAIRADVTMIDLGLVSSDMLSFVTCAYDDIEAGVMITASHNPKEYNGMKALQHSGEPYNLKKYGPEMLEIMENMDSDLPTIGQIETRDVVESWTDHVVKLTKFHDLSPLKIVADGGNGAAGAFMEKLAEKAGFELVPLFLAPDGNFPNHHPNPMLAKNREHARKAIIESQVHAGLIFDGDADRVIVIDEQGNPVNSSVISTIIAESIHARDPHANFCGNAVASHNFSDAVADMGVRYIREKVGHVFIRETMMADRTIAFAGEHSAHYFLRDNYFMDSGIVAAMIFLDLLAVSGLSVSEFTRKYIRYITLEETNFRIADPKGMIEMLVSAYQDETQDTMDGLTVSYADGSWWNVRWSSNEPLLRLNLEAKTQDRYDELLSEIMGWVEAQGAKKVDE